MSTVKRVFFMTKAEAKAIGGYVEPGMPHYELEDGTILYTCGGVADFAIEHWTSTDGTLWIGIRHQQKVIHRNE